MNVMPKINRRSFVIGSAAAGGGLAIGFDLPFGPKEASAQLATPELGVWVVVKPDDTVVVRIARSEMGQGTITGLAQLVAEELEADWSKVTYEYPTPGENVKRKRAWQSYSTGGSRGIRESHEYVRQGGAAARLMLLQAAANEWKVPVEQLQGREQHHHRTGRPQHHVRQGRRRRIQAPGAGEAGAEGSEELEDRRQADQAVRHAATGHRAADLRLRSDDARHAHCDDQGMPGVRRQGEELRRRQGRQHEGREEGPAGR